MIKNYSLILIAFLCFVSSGYGQVSENFDGWTTDTSYGGIAVYNATSGIWETNNSLCDATNARSGRVVRFNDDSGENEYLLYSGLDGNGKDNGIGVISFWYRHWDGDGSNVEFQVQYSTNGGSSWINVGTTVNSPLTTYTQFSSTVNLLGDNILVRVISIDDEERFLIDDFSITDYILTGPEIEIQGNGTEIVDGSSTPNMADDTDFGTTAVAGGTVTRTFTVLNTGGADLTLDGTAPDYVTITPNTHFTVTTQPTLTTLTTSGANSSTTFQITFDPTTLGTHTATVSIDNDDSDEDPYNFAIEGIGTNSNASDIIESPTYVYNSNIDYLLYQAPTITNTTQSIDVLRVDIRDGGASNDTDGTSTELTDISFNVTNIANIRTAALFNGNAQIDNSPSIGGGLITFSGLSYAAADNATASLTLRVTFLANVTDNEQMQFTIDNATANPSGSVFANTNAGGATSSIVDNRNRIEVVADRLNMLQQPNDTSTNTIMSPSVQVEATDINTNRDLDWTGNINISSTGTMTGDPITEGSLNSVSTFSNIVHTVAGNNFNLSASATGLLPVVSSNFNIILFTFNAGDFRPLFATSLAFNGDWEYFNGSAWITTSGSGWDGNAPQNTSTTINRIIIDEFVSGAGSSTNNYDCDILIQTGGTLNIVDNDAPPIAAEFLSAGNSLEVESGGELLIRGDIDLSNSTNLILRDGAVLTIDQNSMTNDHPFWDGNELFEAGSLVEINDWDWGASPSSRSLINLSNAISNNTNGYKFGDFYFNPTNLTNEWTIVGSGLNINVAEGNFEINNISNFFVIGMSNRTAGISSTYNGDFIVSDGNFTFGGSFSNDTFQQNFLIRGNVIINNDDDFYVHHEFNGSANIVAGSAPVIIEGNLEIWGLTNTVTSDVTTKEIIFSGDNTHTIEIAPNVDNIPFIVEGGDTALLLNENLKFTGDSSLEIENNATFNFSFNGSTALEIQNISGGNNRFIQQSGSYLYVTHPQGIWDASANGNVQSFAASNTTYNQVNSTYHYIGNTNQETGDAHSTNSNSKTIICELDNNTDELTVTSRTGTSNLLDIRRGILINTEVNHIFGSGDLNISDGGLRSSVLSATSFVPTLSGTYNLTGGFVQLNAASDQILRGTRAYRDLIFSTSGTKTLSSPPTSITGTIFVDSAAILNVEDNTMGGTGTLLTMTGTSEYITDGVGVKPDALGAYNLGIGTKITFVNNNATLQGVRLFRDYYNIDVEGSNVGTSSATLPIRIQNGGTFTVKPTGAFKFINTDGFNGNTTTSIDNTNNPSIVLDAGSTVEYAGDTQTLTEFLPNYSNVNISGTGIKTLGVNSGIIIGESLDVISSTLQIDDSKYIQVQDNVVNNGSVTISNQGALVQIDDLGTYTSNPASGINRLNKDTSPLQYWYDYTYWSSPLQNAQIENALFPSNDSRRFYFDASQFNDILIENANTNTYSPGHDDIDDDDNDWILHQTGTMIPGVGYAATHSNIAFLPNTSYNYIFEGNPSNGEGGFNTGNINLNIYITPAISAAADYNNWNFIGNPYPSAINVSTFFSETSSFLEGVIYLWSHVTDADANTSGNENSNFSQDDYAILNYVGGIAIGGASPNDPGNIPNGYIASGQSFFVIGNKSHATSGATYYNETVFNNTMRAVDNNNQFFRNPNTNSSDNKLWLNLTSDNGVFNQILVGYVEGATDNLDAMSFDAVRNLSTGSRSLLYTLIPSSEKQYAIQGKSTTSLNLDEVIPLGFYSSINEPTIYTLGIAQLEGEFMTNNAIYVIDRLTNNIHELSATNYSFTSDTGEFNNRFEIVFTADALSVKNQTLDDRDLTITELSDGDVQIKVNSNLTVVNVDIIDVTGRLIYKLTGDSSTEVYNLSQLSKAAYIAKVTLSNGQVISKKAIKQH